MKILPEQLTNRSVMALMVVILFISSSCKSENRSSEESIPVAEDEAKVNDEEYDNNDESMKKVKVAKNEQDTTKKVKVSLPVPEVELPEISYDKKKLSKILELDKMLTDSEMIKVASKQFSDIFQELKDANGYGSLDGDGTPEGKNKAIAKVADSFKKFDEEGKPLGEKIVQFVKDTYGSDDAFGSKYRETYYEAEEQVSEMILDGPLSRKVGSEMSNTYKYGSSMSSYYVVDNLKKAVELKSEVIGNLLNTANIDIMLAENSKDGKSIANFLTGTTNMLNACLILEPNESDLASIKEMQGKVAATKKQRVGEITKAREEYRFPKRYESGNAPENAEELEKRVEAYLEKTLYNGKDKYDVRKSVVASAWFTVRHELTGVVLYHQIDFYVAIKYKHADAGVLDVDYVTMKTTDPTLKTFGSYSIGSVAEMLEKNL